jgi:hypothetical protein
MTVDGETRKATKSKLESRLAGVKAEVEEIENDLGPGGTNLDDEARSAYEEMQSKSALAAERLRAMEQTGVQEWSELVEGCKQAIEEFESAFRTLREQIGGSQKS